MEEKNVLIALLLTFLLSGNNQIDIKFLISSFCFIDMIYKMRIMLLVIIILCQIFKKTNLEMEKSSTNVSSLLIDLNSTYG